MPSLPETFQTIEAGTCRKCGKPAPDRLVCQPCDEEIERENSAERSQKRAGFLRRVGIPHDYATGKANFSTYQPANASQKTALAMAQGWARRKTPPILLLSGPVGTGKTHLASCALIAAIDRINENPGGFATAFFTTFDDFVRRLQSTFRADADRSEERELERHMRADFLVLDDIGVKAPSSYSTGILYAIVNSRWEDLRSTILTTNKTLGELGAAIATKDETVQAERILSRLVDRQRVAGVFVQGPDHRRNRN